MLLPQRLLIDGLNVAYWRGNPPSLQLPVLLCAELRRRGHEAVTIFDANAPYRLLAAERGAYMALLQAEHVVQVRSGVPADRQLLRLARAHNAVIVSRDRFREHRSRYRKLIDEPGRVIGGFVACDVLKLPALEIELPIGRTIGDYGTQGCNSIACSPAASLSS